MGATTDNLKTYYEEQAALLEHAGDKLECLDLISRWYSLRTALDVAEATDVSSYSDPSGASVTRRATSSQQLACDMVKSQILAYLEGRGVVLVDASRNLLTSNQWGNR
jgi:hypothetical protein